jgi:hypothetical protein
MIAHWKIQIQPRDHLPFNPVCGEINHQSYRRSVAVIVVFVAALG